MDTNKRPCLKFGSAKELKLKLGKRLGWWSSRKFDRWVHMRALVMGPLNDERIKLFLDAFANISVISDSLAKVLRLRRLTMNRTNWCLCNRKVKGRHHVTSHKEDHFRMESSLWIWSLDYASARGDGPHTQDKFYDNRSYTTSLFNATAKLPDIIAIPLLRSAKEVDDTTYGDDIAKGPARSLDVESRFYKEFRLQWK